MSPLRAPLLALCACALSALAGSPRRLLTTTTTLSPTVADDRNAESPILPPQYWANASLVGVEVACSAAAKACLAVGRLLHEPSESCYPPGDGRVCDKGSQWVLDPVALRAGELRGICARRAPCPPKAVPMAFDGSCQHMSDFFNGACGTNGRIWTHLTGGYECRPSPVPRLHTPQPAAPGRCILPQMRHPSSFMELPNSFSVACTAAEAACLRRKKLPVGIGCEMRLRRGSCPEGSWRVLDEREARRGRLRATCALERPCGEGALLLRVTGTCHPEGEIRSALCPGENLMVTTMGDTLCINALFNILSLKSYVSNGMCELFFSTTYRTPMTKVVARGPCRRDKRGNCLPTVTGRTSPPDFSQL